MQVIWSAARWGEPNSISFVLDFRLSTSTASLPRLAYSDTSRGIRLYHGNSLGLLDAIYSKYPEGRFDCIFADPPYFLTAR